MGVFGPSRWEGGRMDNITRLKQLMEVLVRKCESNPDRYRYLRDTICGLTVLANRLGDSDGDKRL